VIPGQAAAEWTIFLAELSACASCVAAMAQFLCLTTGAGIMATRGVRRGLARFTKTLFIGVFCTAFFLSAKAAPQSEAPPDPNGIPSVYHSDAFGAYSDVKIGWLPADPVLTAAEKAPEATALAIINQRMAEVAAAWEKKKITIGDLDTKVSADRLTIKMAGLLPGNRRIICASIYPGNRMYSAVIMSVDRNAPLVDPREVWDEDGNRTAKGAFAKFVTDALRVNTWENDTFTGVEIRLCGAG
jgi:Protein of unknown function (DUF2486)